MTTTQSTHNIQHWAKAISC